MVYYITNGVCIYVYTSITVVSTSCIHTLVVYVICRWHMLSICDDNIIFMFIHCSLYIFTFYYHHISFVISGESLFLPKMPLAFSSCD